jgi:hypothetical protein
MTVSRLRGRPRDTQSFGRAKVSRSLLVLLIALRWYAIVAVAIALYAFFHALSG